MAKKEAPAGTIGTEQAARLIMVSAERLRQLTKGGYITQEGRGRYNLVAVVQGYIRFLKDEERRSSRTAAESRVRDARAAEIELRIAEKRRELIEAEEAVAACDKIVGVVRTEIIGLPARVSRDKKIRRQVEEQVHGSLSRIAGSLREVGDALRAGRDVLGTDAEDDA